MSEQADDRDHLIKILKTFETASFITTSPDGTIHGRPMSMVRVDETGDIVMVTSFASGKRGEVDQDARGAVMFQSSSQFASVSGVCRVVRDQGMLDELWSEAWRVWFPNGKSDRDICFIYVTPLSGEYWDQSGSKGIKFLFDAAQALINGTRPKETSEQHAKVEL